MCASALIRVLALPIPVCYFADLVLAMAQPAPLDPGTAAQIAEILAGVAWQCAADCRVHLLEGGTPDGCCIANCKFEGCQSHALRESTLC